MRYSGYELLWLLFVYSFSGWAIETAVATGRKRTFVNRGFFSGPVCFIYGVSGVAMTVFLDELRERTFFLFLGCMILATVIEWCAGKLLERMNHQRWWDYSGVKFNFDGYICLPYSLLWGLLGVLAVRYGNEFIAVTCSLLPSLLGKLLIWVFCGISLADALTSLIAVRAGQKDRRRAPQLRHRLSQWTQRLGTWLINHVERRMARAYPMARRDETETENAAVGQKSCGFSTLFWLFFIGALLGDLVETIFCRLTAGVWMSRSSLVWGPFSIVWGLALALATALLHRDMDKPDRHIFFIGTVLGGAYEYLCSVFTELVFGKVFWDYSGIPFNLGGRINLLYCFFWGIAAVLWIKACYPRIARILDKIPHRLNLILVTCLAICMALNMGVSSLALIRLDQRSQAVPASFRWQQVMDRFFDDERMEEIYPNAISTDAETDTEQ